MGNILCWNAGVQNIYTLVILSYKAPSSSLLDGGFSLTPLSFQSVQSQVRQEYQEYKRINTLPDDPFEDVPVRISFVDYIPAILSTFGMIIVSLINKSQVSECKAFIMVLIVQISRENDDPYAWKARCWLFVGFALLAGGLAGSVVSDSNVLVVQFILT